MDATSERYTVINDDCLNALRQMPDNSVDSIVTDPPAGIAFMGKDWDNPNTFPLRGSRPESYTDTHKNFGASMVSGPEWKTSKKARAAFIAFMEEVFTEAIRVLKPGGHAVVWALPRTSHWTALALEDAGFEIRDCLYHMFGSGFPKSLNVSKAIDAMVGAEREIVGLSPWSTKSTTNNTYGTYNHRNEHLPVTAPASEQAQRYDGYGTGLKPSVECWWLCRKPLAEKSVAANVLTYGTGAINIDASRIASTRQDLNAMDRHKNPTRTGWIANTVIEDAGYRPNTAGRWPAQILLSHSLFCTEAECTEDCPVRLLDEQSGINKGGSHVNGGIYESSSTFLRSKTVNDFSGYTDKGGASRYFTTFQPTLDDYPPFLYTSKASQKERNAGCDVLPEKEGFKKNTSQTIRRVDPDTGAITYTINNPHGTARNHHPTVKPLALMRWLCTLVTPPDGVILDMFAGSGTTGVAALQTGFHCILIEQNTEYVDIIQSRLCYTERGNRAA
jgi:DNA modification methylase